jgi:MFS family permease
MLSVTVFGMVLIAFLINFSVTIVDFGIYLFALWFFTRSDIWMIFIGEDAPKEKRAFWTNIILIFGLSGAILAPILRSRVITSISSNWRPLTWIIIIVGIPLGLLILFTLKEPKVYSDMKSGEQSKESVIKMKQNVKKILQSANRKQIVSALVISFILGVNSVFRNLVENVITSSPFLEEQQISLIRLFGVIAVYIAVFLIGMLADKFGRLPLLYFFSIMIPIARIMFALVVNQPYFTFILTSIFVGLSEFGYWGGWITISIVILELVTTQSRGTGAGLKSFAGAFGITVGFLLTSLITFFSNLSISFIFLGLLTLIIAPLTYLYLKETKRIDMRDISRLKK